MLLFSYLEPSRPVLQVQYKLSEYHLSRQHSAGLPCPAASRWNKTPRYALVLLSLLREGVCHMDCWSYEWRAKNQSASNKHVSLKVLYHISHNTEKFHQSHYPIHFHGTRSLSYTHQLHPDSSTTQLHWGPFAVNNYPAG